MSDKRSWFLPDLGFKTYIQKYPFVFIFSFITAFCWFLKADTPWAFSNPATNLANLGHFQPWAYCCLFGIPLFALIHLLLNSPRLKNFKYHTTVMLLGLGVLLVLFFAMSDGNWVWSDFFRPFLIVTLAAFLWPIYGWDLSKNETQAYFWNMLKGLIKAFAAFFLASGLFIWVVSLVSGWVNGLLNGLLHNRNVFGTPDVIGLSYQVVSPLVFSWYMLGGLLKNLERKASEPAVSFGARTTMGVLVLLAIGLPLEGFKVFEQWRNLQSIFFLDEKILIFLLAILSISMVKAQKGKGFEKWRGIYPKIISGLCVVLILFSGFYHPTGGWGGAWSTDVFYGLIYTVWFLGCFVYIFLRREANWIKPVLSLWLLLIVTWAGPLSPQYLSLKSRELGFKNELTQAGLLKDGVLVKVMPEDNIHQINFLVSGLKRICREDGLNWLKSAFPTELRQLDWSRSNGEANLPQLIAWLGLPPIQTQNNSNQYQSFSTQNDRGQVQWFGPYELINFGFYQGDRGADPKKPEYFMSFPSPGQSLNLIYHGKLIGAISLNSLAKNLSQYSGHPFVLRHMPPQDMVLNYKNKVVDIHINFSNVNATLVDGKFVIQGGNGTMLVRRFGK